MKFFSYICNCVALDTGMCASKLYNYETYDMVMRFAPIPATTRGKGTAAGDAGQISARDRKGHRDRHAPI